MAPLCVQTECLLLLYTTLLRHPQAYQVVTHLHLKRHLRAQTYCLWLLHATLQARHVTRYVTYQVAGHPHLTRHLRVQTSTCRGTCDLRAQIQRHKEETLAMFAFKNIHHYWASILSQRKQLKNRIRDHHVKNFDYIPEQAEWPSQDERNISEWNKHPAEPHCSSAQYDIVSPCIFMYSHRARVVAVKMLMGT